MMKNLIVHACTFTKFNQLDAVLPSFYLVLYTILYQNTLNALF